MQLLYSDASPYARIIRVIIRQLGLANITEVISNPLDNEAMLLDSNPLGKIPCLVLNDGSALFDSEVIARYLDTEFGGERLFGSPYGNWARQCQYSLFKGMLDSAVALRQEQLREQEGARSPFWTARFEQALLRGLRVTETQGVLVDISSANELTAQQISLICLLEYLDFRHPDLQWRNVASATALWFEKYRNLPVFVETRPR